MNKFLHAQKDFIELVTVVADSMGIDPMLVEKDYWIMHTLWGLKAQGFQFELKGGTSLSKGFGVIERFSEDIDIRIEPPDDIEVKTGRNHDKPAHIASRKAIDYVTIFTACLPFKRCRTSSKLRPTKNENRNASEAVTR